MTAKIRCQDLWHSAIRHFRDARSTSSSTGEVSIFGELASSSQRLCVVRREVAAEFATRTHTRGRVELFLGTVLHQVSPTQVFGPTFSGRDDFLWGFVQKQESLPARRMRYLSVVHK